jgi:hypothetical protein
LHNQEQQKEQPMSENPVTLFIHGDEVQPFGARRLRAAVKEAARAASTVVIGWPLGAEVDSRSLACFVRAYSHLCRAGVRDVRVDAPVAICAELAELGLDPRLFASAPTFVTARAA